MVLHLSVVHSKAVFAGDLGGTGEVVYLLVLVEAFVKVALAGGRTPE